VGRPSTISDAEKQFRGFRGRGERQLDLGEDVGNESWPAKAFRQQGARSQENPHAILDLSRTCMLSGPTF
jgi:hypothetical protein